MSEIPWFWPGVALSLAIGVALGASAARAFETSRALGAVLVITAGVIVSATLTPGREALEEGAVGLGTCDLRRIAFASPGELLALDETILNVVLFVPLGLVIGLLPGSRRRRLLAVGVAASPAVIEGLQMLVPVFDRACESADIIDNLTGLALGLVVGLLAGRWAYFSARP